MPAVGISRVRTRGSIGTLAPRPSHGGAVQPRSGVPAPLEELGLVLGAPDLDHVYLEGSPHGGIAEFVDGRASGGAEWQAAILSEDQDR